MLCLCVIRTYVSGLRYLLPLLPLAAGRGQAATGWAALNRFLEYCPRPAQPSAEAIYNLYNLRSYHLSAPASTKFYDKAVNGIESVTGDL